MIPSLATTTQTSSSVIALETVRAAITPLVQESKVVNLVLQYLFCEPTAIPMPLLEEGAKFQEAVKGLAQHTVDHFHREDLTKLLTCLPSFFVGKGTISATSLPWSQKEAKRSHSTFLPELSKNTAPDFPIYVTQDSIIVLGPSLGNGVTRDVRMGALLLSNKVAFCAMNLLCLEKLPQNMRARYSAYSELPHALSENLRTFEMQERLRLVEPGLPQVTRTIYWLHSSASSQAPENMCIPTELFHGSLADCTKKLSSLPGLNQTVRFRSLHAIIKQLAKLHAAGIVHRDLHDYNVLVTLIPTFSQGVFDVTVRAALTDFETAGPILTPQGGGPLAPSLSEVGYLEKAPRGDGPYHPPEIRKIESDWIADYTPACDVYAFGLIILMLYGERHFIKRAPPADHKLSKEKGKGKGKGVANYSYWNPECLTFEYINKTAGFLPGLAPLVLHMVQTDPQLRPTAAEIATFFDSVEAISGTR